MPRRRKLWEAERGDTTRRGLRGRDAPFRGPTLGARHHEDGVQGGVPPPSGDQRPEQDSGLSCCVAMRCPGGWWPAASCAGVGRALRVHFKVHKGQNDEMVVAWVTCGGMRRRGSCAGQSSTSPYPGTHGTTLTHATARGYHVFLWGCATQWRAARNARNARNARRRIRPCSFHNMPLQAHSHAHRMLTACSPHAHETSLRMLNPDAHLDYLSTASRRMFLASCISLGLHS